MAIELYGAAAREAFVGSNLAGNIVEKSGAGMGIGIDKNEPIAGRGGSAAVSGTGDLVDGFEDNFGAGGSGDFGRLIGRIIVADDQFGLPAALMEGGKSGVNVAKSSPRRRSSLNAGMMMEIFNLSR